MTRAGWSATVGLMAGVAGAIVTSFPVVASLEQSIGLPALFFARGPIDRPDRVVVVSIDEASATRMGLPPAIRDWPRSAHAALVDRLVEAGAAVIAFDVQFLRHASADGDRAFAESIGRSRRVVLAQRIEAARTGGTELWERQNPIPELADRALGLAPVPIPDLPAVSWVWAFLTTPTAEVLPSLSAVTLQVNALADIGEFIRNLERGGVRGLEALPRLPAEVRGPDDLLRLMQGLRRAFRRDPVLAYRAVVSGLSNGPGGLSTERARLLRALADLYAGNDVRYLNFVGSPGAVCTIPYDVVVNGGADSGCRLRDAAVFIGLGSGRVARSGQPDTYHTVFPSANGIDFSGVELHATAFANLLGGTAITPLGPIERGVTSVLFGGVLGSTVYWVRTRRRWTKGAARSRVGAAAAGLLLTLVYCGIVLMLFRQAVLLPFVGAIVVQLPLGLFVALMAPPARHREDVRAVCLATDAGGSTAVGQRLAHQPYAQLMDDYRQMLLTTVRSHGGEPVPPEGDGLICLWRCPAKPGEADNGVRLQACRAALAIAAAADRFNARQPPDRQLPTRIGLNAGTVTVCSDADRGVYEVFGDTINVAARLRDLNRELGVRVLASEVVVAGLSDAVASRQADRPILLKGVPSPPVVVELLGNAV
jgi:adenylate cyclase